jgi:hypothetical protein
MPIADPRLPELPAQVHFSPHCWEGYYNRFDPAWREFSAAEFPASLSFSSCPSHAILARSFDAVLV